MIKKNVLPVIPPIHPPYKSPILSHRICFPTKQWENDV